MICLRFWNVCRLSFDNILLTLLNISHITFNQVKWVVGFHSDLVDVLSPRKVTRYINPQIFCRVCFFKTYPMMSVIEQVGFFLICYSNNLALAVFTKVANTLQDIRSDRIWKFVWPTKFLSDRKTKCAVLEKSSRAAGVCVGGGGVMINFK